MCKKAALLLLFAGLLFSGFAQDELIRKYGLVTNERQDLNAQATAIVFHSATDLGDLIEVSINGEQVNIPYDTDVPDFTYFKSFDGVINIKSLKAEMSGEVHLINTGKAPATRASVRVDQQACEFELNAIPQTEWRAGLPVPSYNRTFSNVSHVIVHHAAGSNTASNYTQVVRDIYVYHTQFNGWSDIGYNYLIAQNGDLFTGRDPGAGDQDNVVGAHFCGSNSTTMGVCLLGNYETADPTATALSTLENVLAYKLKKESLDPTGFDQHPLGSIGHIAGHRDGCNTLCPGEHVYDQLAQIRSNVSGQLNNCGEQLDFDLSPVTLNAGEQVTVSNHSCGYENYQWWFEGGQPEYADWQDGGKVTYQNPGIFDVQLIGLGEINDTLRYENILKIQAAPKLYPNPAEPNEIITAAADQVIDELRVSSVDGKQVFHVADPASTTFVLPGMGKGMYIVQLKLDGRWVSQRLLIL